jgi:hypothetical protein
MTMIKAISAIAALLFLAACSSNTQEPPTAGTSVTPGSIAEFRQNVGDRVYFDTDMSSIREDGRTTLARQAEWLKKYTNYPILVECASTWSRRACPPTASRPSATARSGRKSSAPTKAPGRATASASPPSSKRLPQRDGHAGRKGRRFRLLAARSCLKMARFAKRKWLP